MRDFFHGWRPKTACLLLGLAIVLMGAWLRSLVVRDVVKFSPSPHETVHYFVSADGSFRWTRRDIIGGYPASSWRSDNLESLPQWNLSAEGDLQRTWTIRYWSVAIPLTLLSAYLILWKPQNAKPVTGN